MNRYRVTCISIYSQQYGGRNGPQHAPDPWAKERAREWRIIDSWDRPVPVTIIGEDRTERKVGNLDLVSALGMQHPEVIAFSRLPLHPLRLRPGILLEADETSFRLYLWEPLKEPQLVAAGEVQVTRPPSQSDDGTVRYITIWGEGTDGFEYSFHCEF